MLSGARGAPLILGLNTNHARHRDARQMVRGVVFHLHAMPEFALDIV
jgi:hypothetical protein